jgi:hypothetical protein
MSKHPSRELSPEQKAALIARLATHVETATLRPEVEAKYWYRLLAGDDRPRCRTDPHEERLLQMYLEEMFPDDPRRVQRELQKMLSESAVQQDAHCWGANWQYLIEALAAYCGKTPAQSWNMTWTEIAAAFKAAYEARQSERSQPEPTDPAKSFDHSPDFRSVQWGRKLFTFTRQQADCVRVMWQARQKGAPELGQVEILNEAESALADEDKPRLRRVFQLRGKMHDAWDLMIVKGQRKGCYRLAEPPA